MKTLKVTGALILLASQLLSQNSHFKIVQKNTMDGTRVGVTDLNGKEIIPATYDMIVPESDGKFMIVSNQKAGYADTNGKVIVKPQYASGTNFSNGVAFVLTGKKWGMINSKGMPIGQPIYDDVLGMSEGIEQVMINGKIGYVNTAGTQIVPCKYLEGRNCYAGYILVYSTYQDVWGQATVRGQKVNYGAIKKCCVLYNKQGVIIYKGEGDDDIKVTPKGKAIITKTDRSTASFSPKDYSEVIDINGKVLVPYENHYQLEMRDYWVKTTASNPYGIGIMDFDGNILLKPNFGGIEQYVNYKEGTFAKVSFMDGTFFYINTNGRCVELDGIKCPQ